MRLLSGVRGRVVLTVLVVTACLYSLLGSIGFVYIANSGRDSIRERVAERRSTNSRPACAVARAPSASSRLTASRRSRSDQVRDPRSAVGRRRSATTS